MRMAQRLCVMDAFADGSFCSALRCEVATTGSSDVFEMSGSCICGCVDALICVLESEDSFVSESTPFSRMRMAKRLCTKDGVADCFDSEGMACTSTQERGSLSPGTSPHKLSTSIRMANRFCTMDAFEDCLTSEATAGTSPQGRTLCSSTPAKSPHQLSTPIRMAKRLCTMDAVEGKRTECTSSPAHRWSLASSDFEWYSWCAGEIVCRGAALNADSAEFCLESVGATVEAAHEGLSSLLRGALLKSDHITDSKLSTVETMAKAIVEML